MNQHNCTKCNAVYSDNDAEAYLCVPCLQERKEVAKQIDAQFATRPRSAVKSELQEYDEQAKNSGMSKKIDGRLITFIKA